MDFSLELPELADLVPDWSPWLWGAIAAGLVVMLVWRRAVLVFARLEVENRKLKRGIKGYARMEQDHRELSQESRERNAFQSELPALISRLNQEKTTRGICDLLVDFASRVLGAAEASLFLVDGGHLVVASVRGGTPRGLRFRVGEGRMGVACELGRYLGPDEFRNLDPETRSRLGGSVGHDTLAAVPLIAHGQVIGVLNVGGRVRATSAVLREALSVLSHLGATAVENQLNFERLEREATTDGLTQLSNVRNFKEKLRQEIARAARHGRVLSVFLFDIDNFKHYNDRNGHPAGDECLRRTGELLRRLTRVSDLPARYGGEEFVVLLPETDRVGALQFAEKIRAAIEAADDPHREAQPLGCISISGGVATFPIDGEDLESLVKAADEALYRAKKTGRNRVYGPEAAPASGRAVAART